MAEKNPIVTIVMNDGDVMKLELYPEVAENTVNNFISLVNKGFYDGSRIPMRSWRQSCLQTAKLKKDRTITK